MTTKKRRINLRQVRRSENVDDTQVVRRVTVRAETMNDEARSVEVVIATENPVRRFSFERGIVVDEILAMDGVRFRSDKKQLPIVDSHDRSTVANVLGSVRNVRVQGDELIGDAYFARDAASQTAYEKVRDGHITDFSITANVSEIQTVAPGENITFRGANLTGPAEIVTAWTPTDASLVATGADSRSTVRGNLLRSYDVETLLFEESKPMAKKPENASPVSDDSQALTPVERNEQQVETPKVIEPTVSREEIQRADRQRCSNIRRAGDTFDIERTQVDKWCEDGTSIEDVNAEILRILSKTPHLGSGVSVVKDDIENLYDAARDGLTRTAYTVAGIKAAPFNADNKAAPGADDLSRMGLLRLAEKFVQRMGGRVERMAPRDIAMAAMGHDSTLRRHNIERSAYHTTGSFPQLLADVANKTLLAAYEEAPYTWSMWARQAASVADFKNINRTRLSETTDLKVVPENQPYHEQKQSDSKESYSVEKYGGMFSVTWETIVNDDLNAISRIPGQQGIAARRTQNKHVYAVLTDNAAMSDGTALFASGHSNLDASGAAPSVAELNAAYVAMMTQTGINGEIINVEPTYIIGPPSLRGTILQLLGSFSDPVAGGSAAGNSNTINIHQNGLIPIIEPQLEANSTTAWYLAASPGQLDTVELSFLSGEETPVLEEEWDFTRDCYRYKIRQTFGVKAIDWRGLYKNPGV